MLGHEIDVAGVGGTLTANALALAAIRATLSTCLRDEDFAVAVPLAERFTDGVAGVIASHDLPWHVQRLGCRAEYWFCPPPRDGAAAAAAVDDELEGFMHLWALNRGVLLTPFHNMALFSPHHTEADVDRHTEVFGEAVAALIGWTAVRRSGLGTGAATQNWLPCGSAIVTQRKLSSPRRPTTVAPADSSRSTSASRSGPSRRGGRGSCRASGRRPSGRPSARGAPTRTTTKAPPWFCTISAPICSAHHPSDSASSVSS